MAVHKAMPVNCWFAEQIQMKTLDFPALENLGQLPWVFLSSGLLNLHTATAFGAPYFMMPFRYKIIKAWVNVVQAPGTAPGGVFAGTYAAAGNDNILFYNCPLATTGFKDITSNLIGGVPFEGAAGDVIGFKSDGNATATGLAFVSLLAVRSPS